MSIKRVNLYFNIEKLKFKDCKLLDLSALVYNNKNSKL